MRFTAALSGSLLMLGFAVFTATLLFIKYKKSKTKVYRNLAIALAALVAAYAITCLL